MSHRIIRRWPPPMLDLKVPQEAVINQVRLLLVLDLRLLNKRYEARQSQMLLVWVL